RRAKVITLPQSGRLDDGEQPQGLPDARAPRLFAVTVCIPAVDITLRLVGFSRRLCSASHPPVETVYSLAQKVAPWPWRWRPPSCRATVIADVPWREATTAATTSDPGLPDFHNTKSEGQALRVSLVKPGAYLSASYTTWKVIREIWGTQKADAVPLSRERLF